MKTAAVLLAAGSGTRLSFGIPKAFVDFHGESLILSALKVLHAHKQITTIIVVVPREKIQETKKITQKFEKIKVIVGGGKTRIESLTRGVQKVGNEDFVLIHNAANPSVSLREISVTLAAAVKYKAAAVGAPVTATVKKVSRGRILGSLDRSKIWLTETPQVLETKVLKKGLSFAFQKKLNITDDVQLAEIIGICPKIVQASQQNRKITTKTDLITAQHTERRVGFGQDSHRFSTATKPLVLAGICVSKTGGLVAKSDGDVVLHALINAISSALGGGSLSVFADKICANGERNSIKYLAEILFKMRDKKFQIENVSIAIEAAQPKLEKRFPRFKKNLGKLLGVSTTQIGITVTSGENLTAWGRGEGIQTFVFILLKRCG